MTILREEFDALYSFIVANPGMQPFLGNEASVFLLPQIARRFNPTSLSMAYSGRSMDLALCIFLPLSLVPLLVFIEPLLSHLLIPGHHLLLIISQLCLLTLELVHAFINGPWPHEFP